MVQLLGVIEILIALTLPCGVHDAVRIVVGEVHRLVISRGKLRQNLKLFLLGHHKVRQCRIIITILNLLVIWCHLLVKYLTFSETDIQFILFFENVLILLEVHFYMRRNIFSRLIEVTVKRLYAGRYGFLWVGKSTVSLIVVVDALVC